MFKVACICTVALLGSTEAFVPQSSLLSRTKTSSSSSSLEAKSESLPFYDAPENIPSSWAGNRGFDPFGFSDVASPEQLRYLRAAEIKHGRVCMLAALGFAAVDNGLILPSNPKVSSLLAHDTMLTNMGVMMAFIGAIEAATSGATMDESREPGDYGFDPMGLLKGKDAKFVAEMKEKEINNGRLAMMGYAGMVTQAALFDTGFPYIGPFA
uniref:Plastid light harvesting protein n=1 Tax=Chromera velia CCMP2878 TaxID=1169474 RepID=A0A0G4I6M3_9ALVE|eukprot:Cvel_11363.t1-p1 / transcript=Cvel_11363.t1 / gene=Cvel_11363 / organism=Chromera_velia_CCMP2878 / gene_product=Fucoxanthin-chlorophyll a-c binding protein,, putative / transcript_product=Fucoxanthin-chlorophyll a-c binding protein,, putative / location=Cvel_scaffold712:27687-30065(+) / protein_length=210 / sequence_SO=supercontig / SO=protein_coding / is_pseudo=false